MILVSPALLCPRSKSMGYNDSLRTAGFVLSVLSVVLAALPWWPALPVRLVWVFWCLSRTRRGKVKCGSRCGCRIFWRKDAITFPYLSLFGGRCPPTACWDGRTGLRPAGCSAGRCKRFGLSRDDCAYLYILGAVGALVGAKLLYLLPPAPAGCGAAPLWEEPGELSMCLAISPAAWCFDGGFFGGVAAAWGAAKYLRLRLSDFFPVLGARPASGARRGAGRLFLRRLLLWTGGPAPPGIALTYAIAGPNGVPLLPVQLWEAGAELVIFAFLLWYAGRAAGPGQMLRAMCSAMPRCGLCWSGFGGSARGMYGPLSTSQWLSLVVLALALAWPVAGRKLKKYGRERVSQQKGNRDKSDSRTFIRTIGKVNSRADAPKRAAGSGCLNFRFHDSRRTFRQDLFYI